MDVDDKYPGNKSRRRVWHFTFQNGKNSPQAVVQCLICLQLVNLANLLQSAEQITNFLRACVHLQLNLITPNVSRFRYFYLDANVCSWPFSFLHGIVYLYYACGSNFPVWRWNPGVWSIKRKLDGPIQVCVLLGVLFVVMCEVVLTQIVTSI